MDPRHKLPKQNQVVQIRTFVLQQKPSQRLGEIHRDHKVLVEVRLINM